MDNAEVVERTRQWISNIVIGLNLCPFARRVFEGELISFAVTDVADADALSGVLVQQLDLLATTPEDTVETAFLIHPHALTDFLDYNDFVADAEVLLAEMGLEGVIQIASFHPHYQFAGTKPNDLENYTNRSPFPMLHLLRESSVTRVNSDPERLLDIPNRNIETLRRLGPNRLRELLGDDPL